MDKEKIKCIYYIKDLRTDKIIYIGQTINFDGRKQHHFSHKKQPIDMFMFENGRENFSMEKFDIDYTNITYEEIKKKEDELILQYDTINNGLNKYRSGFVSEDKEYQREYKKEYDKEYRKTEKYKEYRKTEKYKEYQREYKKEYDKEYNKEYRKTEKHKQYLKEYYQSEKYKEKKRQYRKEYYQKHKK